jgi:hypothetical protein
VEDILKQFLLRKFVFWILLLAHGHELSGFTQAGDILES